MGAHSIIARLIAEWAPSSGNDDNPLFISLDGVPTYLPLLQPKQWYNQNGRRLHEHRVLGLSVEGEWAEDGSGSGHVSWTYGSTAMCFGNAPFALAPLALVSARYPALREIIWNAQQVANIEDRYLSKWHALVAALRDGETRDSVWLLRHDLASVETALGRVETPRMIDALVAGLQSPVARLRQAAVHGLRQTTPGRGLDRPVMDLADDKNAVVRAEVAYALSAIGTHEALSILLRYLHDEPPIGVAAIDALVAHGFPEAREEIERLATNAVDADAGEATISLHVAAILALQTFWARDDTERLVKLLRSGAPAVRATAAFVLGKVGIEEAAAALYPLLWDSTPEVRMSAAWSLGELRHDEIIPRLVELAQHGVDYFVDPVTQTGERERSIALLTLRALAKDSSDDARAAIEALGLTLE